MFIPQDTILFTLKRDSFIEHKTALQVKMIHSCYCKMVLWFYYCIHIFKIIYMLLNSLTMVGAILIEICTSAPYRPGHWLLSDVTPEPQTLLSPPSPPPSPLSLLVPVWQQAPLSLATHSQSCIFHPSLVHFTSVLYISPHGQLVGGTNWVPCMRGHYPVCDWGRGPGEDR